VLVAIPAAAAAVPLDQVIPNLFGGSLNTTIIASTGTSTQTASIVGRFQDLNAQLSTARAQVPLPSASGAFRFAWDPDLDTFVRFEQSLGSGLAERAQTIGRGRFNVGVSYQHVDFSTVDGESLSHVRTSQPAFTQEYLAQQTEHDREVYGDDLLNTTLNLHLSFDLLYLSAAYGLTDDIDVSLALAINHAHMQGSALAETISPDGRMFEVGRFVDTQKGLIVDGTGPICGQGNRCARDTFNQSATGTGDLYLRAKWHIADTWLADLAAAGVLTVPTGNADNLLGYNDPTFTPWFIASKSFGRFSPHINLGYAFRSAEDVSQAQWIVGSDFLAARWLTLSADFLGYHDDKRDGINDDVIQSAVGFKINPWGSLVLDASFQFPVNRDGIRADVIYTGQVEYTF